MEIPDGFLHQISENLKIDDLATGGTINLQLTLVLVRDQVAVVLCCAALAGQPHWFLVLLCCCAWMNITRKGVVRCIASHFCFWDNNVFM